MSRHRRFSPTHPGYPPIRLHPPPDPPRLHPSTIHTGTCTTENPIELVNGATYKGGETSKGATTNSGATYKGGDTPNSGSPSPAETFTLTGGPTQSNRI